MKALQAGYVSGAVWNAIQKGQLRPELDWKDIVTGLSHFVIDHDVGGNGVLTPELSIFENLLCRGLPTLPSLYLERYIAGKTGLVDFEESGGKDIAAFRCEIKKDVETEVLALVGRALCAVSATAELGASEGFVFPEFGSGEERTDFDSNAEREFWYGPLSDLLGKGGMQLALLQRPLDSISESFTGRRADVTVQFPGSNGTTLPMGIVLEVDGQTHGNNNARNGDARRDEACLSAGFAPTYRHRLWQHVQASAPIDRNHPGVSRILDHPYLTIANLNVEKPLKADMTGSHARMLALFPMAVARIQRVLLELVRGGVLQMDAAVWDVALFDRDGLPGCGTLAAEDMKIWFAHIYALYSPGYALPEIRVHEFSHSDSEFTLPENVDVLLDVSVEMRYGMSQPTPEPIRNISNLAPRVVVRSDYYTRVPYRSLSFSAPAVLQLQDEALERELTFFLQNVFRKVAFREKQVDIITRALKNESVIALLPTGAGKSITYQLPSLLQNGVTVVIDPIKSLMKDQDDNLKAAGISASAFINSMSSSKERRRNSELMEMGCFKFVFVSPERFIIRNFRDALDRIKSAGRVYFAYAVVDEAHCVSEWGHDFRTSYLRLGVNTRRYCATRVAALPLLALTGTASLEVLEDVHLELGFGRGDDIAVRPEKMERENLIYRVIQLDNPPAIPEGATDRYIDNVVGDAKLRQLPNTLSALTKELCNVSIEEFLHGKFGSGLIFCPHAGVSGGVHGVVRVRGALVSATEDCDDVVGVYYGSPEERAGGDDFDPVKTQDDFKKDILKVLACTKAFGMGIDKPDVRFTLHHNIPSSLESFYQEAGRAGRDTHPAQCWIYYSGVKHPDTGNTLDYQLNHSFHTNAFPGPAIEQAKVFEILDENRVPGSTAVDQIALMLCDEKGIAFKAHAWSNHDATRRRLYLDHPDYPDTTVYLFFNDHDQAIPWSNNPYPEYIGVINLVRNWMSRNKPADISLWDWLNVDAGVVTGDGIEAILGKSEGRTTAQTCLAFDNGYLRTIAKELDAKQKDIDKAYMFADTVEDFIAELSKTGALSVHIQDRIRQVFPNIRLREHTFRAVYRLSILGIVDDFEADYNTETLTATLKNLSEGECLENFAAYIRRHAPMQETHYRQIAMTCDYPTELRRCLHALITFTYDRIAKQRQEALTIMEQTCVRGISDAKAFSQAVTYFFDSGYLPYLKPHLNDYTPDLVFKIVGEMTGGNAQLSHLLGACNRLLPENPDNAAFHALRAYAVALLGYKDQDVRDEIDKALVNFERYHGWTRKEKLSFLMKLRRQIAAFDMGRARVFDAAIVDDHTRWLHSYRTGDTGMSADHATGQAVY